MGIIIIRVNVTSVIYIPESILGKILLPFRKALNCVSEAVMFRGCDNIHYIHITIAFML